MIVMKIRLLSIPVLKLSQREDRDCLQILKGLIGIVQFNTLQPAVAVTFYQS